jgi:hypothetical protein
MSDKMIEKPVVGKSYYVSNGRGQLAYKKVIEIIKDSGGLFRVIFENDQKNEFLFYIEYGGVFNTVVDYREFKKIFLERQIKNYESVLNKYRKELEGLSTKEFPVIV